MTNESYMIYFDNQNNLNSKYYFVIEKEEKMTGKIVGMGVYVPAYSMDNHKLEEYVDTTDEWIRERTGIKRRYIAGEGETTTDMAIKAAQNAMKEAQIKADALDLIIVATVSSFDVLPSTACMVQDALDAVNATCFDISAACSGFMYAYNTVQAYMKGGLCKNALIIGSETLSNIVDWEDRGTCILFGDGAGAALISLSNGKDYIPITHSSGALGGALTLKNRFVGNGIQTKRKINYDKAPYFMKMDGQAVFKFAVSKVPEVIEEVLEANHIQKHEIACYALHQANGRIIEAVARRLKEPKEKFPVNVEKYGNTSSASIPLLLKEMRDKKIAKKGDKVVMAGFGAGLTWGACIFEW